MSLKGGLLFSLVLLQQVAIWILDLHYDKWNCKKKCLYPNQEAKFDKSRELLSSLDAIFLYLFYSQLISINER